MQLQQAGTKSPGTGRDGVKRGVPERETRGHQRSQPDRETDVVSSAAVVVGESSPAIPGLAFPAATALAIPSLHKSIPTTLDQVDGVSLWARLAMNMLSCGMIQPDSISRVGIKSISKAVLDGLQNWINSYTTILKHINFSLYVANHPGMVSADGGDIEEAYEAIIKNKGTPIFIAAQHDYGSHLLLEESITAIEQLHPGFGQYVLSIINVGFFRTLQAYTPSIMFEVASMHYWMGESDESTYVEEMGLDGEKSEDCDLFTRATFNESFPDWVVFPKGKFSKAAIKRITKSNDDLSARVAQVVLELRKCIDQKWEMPIAYCNTWYFRMATCCILRWNTNDLTYQIIDDFEQYAMESGDGYADLHGVSLLNLNSDTEFHEWKLKMEQGLHMITLLDQLIGLVGKPENLKE